MNIFEGVMVGGGAIVMAVITVGPMYLLFEVLPKMQQAVRKERFLELRRELRKERARKSRLLS